MIRRFLRSNWWWSFFLPVVLGLNFADVIRHTVEGRYWFAAYNAVCVAILSWCYISNWRIKHGRHRKSSASPAGNAASRAIRTRAVAFFPTAGSAVARINADHPAPKGPGQSLGAYRDGIIKQLAAELTHEGFVVQALLLIEETIRSRGYGPGIGETFMIYRAMKPAQVGVMTEAPTVLEAFPVVCGADPPPLPTSKIEFGEIEAYRCWLVREGRLFSLYAADAWPFDEPLKSKIEDHYLTAGGGGIHAFKDLCTAGNYGFQYVSCYADCVVAVGKVRLFGEVIEHESGYRAEFARVGSIECILPGAAVDTERTYAQAQTLRERYGIEVAHARLG